jgi:Fur family peroxide stress response transcriptional regulator
VDSIVARWKKQGIKRTPKRVAILREILGDTTHPSAEALYKRLRRRLGLSFATIYNNLESMVRNGDVGVLRVNDTMRFDPNLDPHHHAICEGCGEIFDVPARANIRVSLPRGFRNRRVSLEFRGECRSCRGKAKKNGTR